jgi:hypothetical protein
MNLAQLREKLMAAARANPPGDTVPYAFEKRIMARIASPGAESSPDLLALWSRVLWRAAAPCVALSLALGIWNFVAADHNSSAETLAADLEETVYAPFNSLGDTW